MRKIILNVAVSLDGFIEGPLGEYDWCFMDQDYGMGDFLSRIDAIFYGRKSYEVMLAAGPNPFADKRSYVFSNSSSLSFEGVEWINGDVVNKVKTIKQQSGGDIWLFGGASLTSFFLNEGLVDELSLAVHPILLGSGKPLFQNIPERKSLTLIGSKQYNTGLVILNYKLNPS